MSQLDDATWSHWHWVVTTASHTWIVPTTAQIVARIYTSQHWYTWCWGSCDANVIWWCNIVYIHPRWMMQHHCIGIEYWLWYNMPEQSTTDESDFVWSVHPVYMLCLVLRVKQGQLLLYGGCPVVEHTLYRSQMDDETPVYMFWVLTMAPHTWIIYKDAVDCCMVRYTSQHRDIWCWGSCHPNHCHLVMQHTLYRSQMDDATPLHWCCTMITASHTWILP